MASLLITNQFLLVCFLMIANMKMIMAQSPFLEQPASQNVTYHGTATLVCIRRPEANCNVFWHFAQSGKYFTRNKYVTQPADPPHYSLSAADPHDFTLTIHNATSADSGGYQCTCIAQGQLTHSHRAELNVFIPPDPPTCYHKAMEKSQYYVGQRVNFHCRVENANPAADLKWIRGKNQELIAGVKIDNSSMGKTFISESIYQTYMSAKDFGKIFTCIVTSAVLDRPLTCTIGPLYPKSLVHIDVRVTPEEMETLSLECLANTSHLIELEKQPNLNYSWYINNDAAVEYGLEAINTESDKPYITFNQSIKDLPINTQISCEVFGPYGSLGQSKVIINENHEITYVGMQIPNADQKTDDKFDIRPIIFINAGALMLLAFLLLMVFCVPKRYKCAKKKQRSPLRRRDSRYADMQFTRTNPCPSPLLMTPPPNLNTYDSTDSDTESSKGMSRNGSIPTVTTMSQSQQQQVQATLHVVVHSPNNQGQTTTLKACSTDDYADQNNLYHELPPMPNMDPPPPPTNKKSPSKRKFGSFSGKKSPKPSPSKSRNSRRHSSMSYDHIPAQQNQYAPTSHATGGTTTTATTNGYYVHMLPLPGHQEKIITSCLRCNHNNMQNNNHLSATYNRNRDSVGVVYENIPLPPHTCNGQQPAPL